MTFIIFAGCWQLERWMSSRRTRHVAAASQAFLQAGALCQAFELPFSFHCAPAVHLAAACALPAFWVGEYFFDHARIERMLFDGVSQPIKGALMPDRSRPGFGLEFKRADAARFAL